jgi:predicted acyltransferase
LYAIAIRPKQVWWIAFATILIGYWLWFALTPVPAQFDYSSVGVQADWLRVHGLMGFASHWQKNVNPAAAVDRWFLNLFPQQTIYRGAPNGLTTLNFVPSIATMILGLAAADVLQRAHQPRHKLQWLLVAAVMLIAGGWFVGFVGAVPVVKAIWTPAWVLYSGGWCFLFLAVFYATVDMAGYRRMAFPLKVVGLNSILAYCLSHVFPAVAFNSIRRVVGARPFEMFGVAYEPVLYGAAVFAMYWLILYVLYQRRIFLRI